MSKLPSQLSYEQLMAMLNSEDTPEAGPVLEVANDVIQFLTTYEITPGNTQVSKKLLYKLYKTYSKSPVSPQEFATKVGEFIPDQSREYYHINQDNFAISLHIYNQEKKIDKTKRISSQKHFEWVKESMGLERGSNWLEGFIIFYLYKDHCKAHRVNPKLGYKSFHNFLKLHFQYKRRHENRSMWFKVDDYTYNRLTEMEKNVIREARQKTGRSEEEAQPETEENT